MSEVISVRVSDAEQNILKEASKLYGCGISSLLKQLAFEKLEDEFDMDEIRKYEEEKANGTLKLYSHDEVRKDLGI